MIIEKLKTPSGIRFMIAGQYVCAAIALFLTIISIIQLVLGDDFLWNFIFAACGAVLFGFSVKRIVKTNKSRLKESAPKNL